MTDTIAPLQGHEIRGETEILRDVANQPGLETIEGRLVPLLSGERIKSHIIVMHPGQYAAAHAHPTESIIYTISGSWVSSTTTDDGEELRSVINEGDLFTKLLSQRVSEDHNVLSNGWHLTRLGQRNPRIGGAVFQLQHC